MTSTHSRKREASALLKGSPALPPCCERYLDFETLGSSDERKEVLELITDEYRQTPGPNRTTTPRTYARRIVDTLDAVTINLLRTSLEQGLLKYRVLNRIISRRMQGIAARNYIIMMLGVSDLEARSGTMRQFDGLHDLTFDADGKPGFVPLDLSTDDLYLRNLALLRYGVMVLNGLSVPDGAALFVERRGEDMIIMPKMRELIWNRYESVDRIAGIVIERNAQDADLISRILDSEGASALNSGEL